MVDDDNEVKKFLLFIEPALHKRLKLYCVDNDMYMNDFICDATEKMLEKEEKEKSKRRMEK